MEFRWEYILIIAICLVIAIAITRSKKKDFKLEANKLIMLLGGKDNVIDYEFNISTGNNLGVSTP